MMSFDEFKQRKKAVRYRGSDDDLRREYDAYLVNKKSRSMDDHYSVESEGKDVTSHELARIERSPENLPLLSIVFYILAGLSLLGGIILVKSFWPGDAGFGNEWKTIAYSWSIIWGSASIIEAGIFAAIGSSLSYLNRIAINTAK